MDLLIEKYEILENQIIQEGTEKPEKAYYVEGICIQSNVKNRNNRIYPKEIVKREVDRYINEEINKNRAVGELDHPEDGPGGRYKNVSHKFISLKESGDNWIGKAKVTTHTPMGAIVAGLMDEGIVMGISTRAMGSTKLCEGNVRVVQNDFRLVSAGDIVSDPSAPDAFLQNLIEQKEWVWENGMLMEKEKEIISEVRNTKLSKYNRESRNQAIESLFSSILQKI